MKSMKKLVLAGLVLLASVVVFVGCKNDSVPESTPVTETVQEIPYLTFSATAEQTMTISTSGTYTLHESLEYSVNKGDWKQLVAGTPITFGGENGDLRMRGKSAGGTSTDIENFSTVSFGNSDVMVSCTGDIRTLVDWEAHTTASTSQARFPWLFYECSSLISAPALPATTLAYYCYSGMFSGCTSLTTAPALLATTLAEGCYNGMFDGCTSLNSVTMLATDISATGCLAYWLRYVAATGTFTKAEGLAQGDGEGQIPDGTDGIPSGWTVKNHGE